MIRQLAQHDHAYQIEGTIPAAGTSRLGPVISLLSGWNFSCLVHKPETNQ
jgi:hypothetical protein